MRQGRSSVARLHHETLGFDRRRIGELGRLCGRSGRADRLDRRHARRLEPIHAAAFTKDQAVFWVSSNGCTRKEDLIPIVSIKGGDAIITLRRIDEDTCDKPSIRGVELKWSFEELGLAPGSPVSVNNPYQLPQT